ncbi:hypothetical protein HZU75_04275 [Chitinibacter fontanus]|uniref:Phage antitermination protein Q n=1 Tax=Chitinibacter fontanus TaxID=1737446 RepID=A0A7D5ZFH6_9NEIS|nr:hypothetical protein [Chitinibacter fontanus]QLI80807.1 hypothetical protein HZU75_04275 [Chitinibacter fontanus]
MIDFINERLMDWADWVGRRDDCGLGYVQSQLARLGEASGGAKYGGLPAGVSEADLFELHKIVTYLPFELRQAVWQCYMVPGTAAQHARSCGCHRDTYYERLHKAHVLVMEALQLGVDEVPLLVIGRAALSADLRAGNDAARKNEKKVLTA